MLTFDDSAAPHSLDEAWEQTRELVEPADESDMQVYRAIFVTGMATALSIIFHHGIADLRKEIEREQKGMSDDAER